MKKQFILVLFLVSLSAIFQAQQVSNKPFMGVTVDTLSSTFKKQYGLKKDQGIIVKELLDQSSAKAADIRVDDILVQLNDSTIRNTKQFVAMLQAFNAGDKIELRFYRAKKLMVKSVELKPRPN